MNIHRILLPLLFCGTIALAKSRPPTPSPAPLSTPAPPTATPTPETNAALDALRKPYDAALASLVAEREKSLAGVDGWYLPNLEKLQDQIAKTGDLDGAVAVKNERSRIAAHEASSAEQIQAMPPSLRTLRGQYDAFLKKVADQIDRRKADEARKYITALEGLQKHITMTGDIEQALSVKAEKDRIAASIASSAPKIASTTLKAPEAAAPTATPAATQIGAAKEDDFTSILVGQWQFTYEQTGVTTTVRFSADGTVKDVHVKSPGHWTLRDNKIVIIYPNGQKEDMHMPLNPAGTRVYADRGRVIKAVKLPGS